MIELWGIKVTRKKLAVIISGIVVLIVIILVRAYHSGSPGSSSGPNPSASSATKTTHFDENALINRGVTYQQINSLEQVLGQYLSSQGPPPSQVDFNSIVRTPTDPANPNPFSELTFIVQVDGQPAYKAKLDSFSTSQIRLYLYSLDGKTLLYDSQNVGGSPG